MNSFVDCILIFDIMFCDGEQFFGVILIVEEKLSIVRVLVCLGVDIIEVGFFFVSFGDFEVVQKIV